VKSGAWSGATYHLPGATSWTFPSFFNASPQRCPPFPPPPRSPPRPRPPRLLRPSSLWKCAAFATPLALFGLSASTSAHVEPAFFLSRTPDVPTAGGESRGKERVGRQGEGPAARGRTGGKEIAPPSLRLRVRPPIGGKREGVPGKTVKPGDLDVVIGQPRLPGGIAQVP